MYDIILASHRNLKTFGPYWQLKNSHNVEDVRHIGNPAILIFDRVHPQWVWNVSMKFEINSFPTFELSC